MTQRFELVVGELTELRHALGFDASAQREREQRGVQWNRRGAHIRCRAAGHRPGTVTQLAARPLLNAVLDQRIVDRHFRRIEWQGKDGWWGRR